VVLFRQTALAFDEIEAIRDEVGAGAKALQYAFGNPLALTTTWVGARTSFGEARL
jgi:hypothetical protein